MRKRIVPLCFGRGVCTCLGVAIFEVPLKLSCLVVDCWSSFTDYKLLISLFASLQSDWAISICILLGPATCLPDKDGGISLDVLPKDTTSKLAGLFMFIVLLI